MINFIARHSISSLLGAPRTEPYFPRGRSETRIEQVARDLRISGWLRNKLRGQSYGWRGWRDRKFFRDAWHRGGGRGRRERRWRRILRIGQPRGARHRGPRFQLRVQGIGHAFREVVERVEVAGERVPVLRCSTVHVVRERGARGRFS